MTRRRAQPPDGQLRLDLDAVSGHPIPTFTRYRLVDRGHGQWAVIGQRGREIRPAIQPNGRAVYVLRSDDGALRAAQLARIVLLVHVGPPPPDRPLATHRNDVPADCRLTNLRWASRATNANDASINGRLTRTAVPPEVAALIRAEHRPRPPGRPTGTANGDTAPGSVPDLARRFGLTVSTVTAVLRQQPTPQTGHAVIRLGGLAVAASGRSVIEQPARRHLRLVTGDAA